MKNQQQGLTLIELTVVLLILIALAGVAIPFFSGTHRMASCQATDATLQAVKEALMGGASGLGFYSDFLGQFPERSNGANTEFNLHFLFSRQDVEQAAASAEYNLYNPKTAVGWRGPYLINGGGHIDRVAELDARFAAVFDVADPATDAYTHFDLKLYDGADADAVASADEARAVFHVFDAWGRPIILQIPYDTNAGSFNYEYARLVSAGPGGGPGLGNAQLSAKINYDGSGGALPDAADRDEDRVLYLQMPDPLPGGNVACVQ